MDLQSTLTYFIEVVFWAFVILIISDFINGIFALQISTDTTLIPESVSSVIAPQFEQLPNHWELKVSPQQITISTTQFEEISDPWDLETASPNNIVRTQAVMLPFPTLRLLPPVQEIELKRTKITKKANSTAKQKSVKAESPRKPGRPRKKAA